MSTSNDNKKGMSNTASTPKAGSTTERPTDSTKGLEQKDAKDDKKSDRSSTSTSATSKMDQDTEAKNNKNK